MVDLTFGAKAIRPGVKAFQFVRYRKAKARILDEALLDALDAAFEATLAPDSWTVANPRLAARNLLEELKSTDAPGIVSRSSWDKTKRWLNEFQTMRFPSLDVQFGPLDPRLQRWIADALTSKGGQTALRAAGLSPVLNERDAHQVAELATGAFRLEIRRFDHKSAFEDRVRAELLLSLQALDNSPETVLHRRSIGAASTAPVAGVLSGGVATAITSTATDLQTVDSVGAGVVVAVLVTLGAGILLRRRPLTRPQFEMRRAVLGWLSTLVDQLYGLRPEVATVQAVDACLERAIGRHEGKFGDKLVGNDISVSISTSSILPERHRLQELIGLADTVKDSNVQAALIALDSAAWSARSRHELFAPIQNLLATLSS